MVDKVGVGEYCFQILKDKEPYVQPNQPLKKSKKLNSRMNFPRVSFKIAFHLMLF